MVLLDALDCLARHVDIPAAVDRDRVRTRILVPPVRLLLRRSSSTSLHCGIARWVGCCAGHVDIAAAVHHDRIRICIRRSVGQIGGHAVLPVGRYGGT